MAENFAFIASFFPTKPAEAMEIVPPETNMASEAEPELSSCIADNRESDRSISNNLITQAPAASVQPACNRPFPPISQASRARFLNAAALPFSVDVLIDGRLFWQNTSFGKISDYIPVTDGFHTITLRRSDRMRAVLYQNQFPFRGGQKFTFTAVDSPSGGVNLIQLADTGCTCQSCRFGCYRVANMSFPGSSFDIRMANGDTAFSRIGFTQASPYKQTAAGSYRFFVTEAASLRPIREMPVILQAFLSGSLMTPRPLLSYSVNVQAGKNYTTYLVGNTWTSFPFQALTVED